MPSTEFTPNNVWASTPAESIGEELTLPSGQTCLAKRIGMEGLIEMGILEQVDSLTAMVEQHTRTIKKNGPQGPAHTEVDEKAMMADPGALKSVIGLADRAMPVIVISPVVKLHFTEETVGKTKVTKMIPAADRVEGVVYTDQINLEDKMFLFEWSSGGLKSFLGPSGEPPANVGTVGPVPKAKKPTKRTSRRV